MVLYRGIQPNYSNLINLVKYLLLNFRHINDRKPKAFDDGPVVEDVEHVEEEICCSSDSETEAQPQGDLGLGMIPLGITF